MSQAAKRKGGAERDLQRAITNMAVIDSIVEMIQQKDALQKKGVWGRISSIELDDLEDQLERNATVLKTSDNKLDAIVQMFETDRGDVEFSRGADFDRAREAIEQTARKKNDEDAAVPARR